MAETGDLLSLDFEPDAKAINIGLEKWSKLIKDWRPIWTDVVKVFHRHELRHFESEGASTGTPWPNLSESYAAWKDENAPSPGLPILVFHGTMRSAFVTKSSDSLIEKGKRSFAIGVRPGTLSAKKAGGHSRGAGNLPKRPPIRLDPSPRKGVPMPFGAVVAQIAQAHIIAARKKSFGRGDPFVTEGKPMSAETLTRLATK